MKTTRSADSSKRSSVFIRRQLGEKEGNFNLPARESQASGVTGLLVNKDRHLLKCSFNKALLYLIIIYVL